MSKNDNDILGEGIFKKMKKGINRAKKSVNKSVNKVDNKLKKVGNVVEKVAVDAVKKVEANVNMYRDIFLDIDRMPPNVKNFIKNHKDDVIQRVIIGRSKIPKPINVIMKTFGGKISYDNIYHLFIIVYTNKTHFIFEKNERINIGRKIPQNIEERVEVQGFSNMKVIDMFNNTKKIMGDKFLPYDSWKNNCQNFISNIMKGNGIGDVHNDFILQDTHNIFKGKPFLKGTSNTMVGIGKVANILSQGGTLGDKIKILSNSITPKMNAWRTHLMKFYNDKKKADPSYKFKDAMRDAAKTAYKK
jgi:hypothetical protein